MVAPFEWHTVRTSPDQLRSQPSRDGGLNARPPKRARAGRAVERPLPPMTSPRRVFFMQCGFGMLEAGSVTARATTNILLKNLLDASISAVAWYSLGYGLAFERGNPFLGWPSTDSADERSLFFGIKMLHEDANGFQTASSSSGYGWAFWWFQFVSDCPHAPSRPRSSIA